MPVPGTKATGKIHKGNTGLDIPEKNVQLRTVNFPIIIACRPIFEAFLYTEAIKIVCFADDNGCACE